MTDSLSRLPFKNEIFIMTEKYVQEILIKVLLHPKKYAFTNKLMHSLGIDGSAWTQPLHFPRTPRYDDIHWGKFENDLSDVSDEAQKTSPQTKLVLSYIPVTTEICDKAVRDWNDSDCPEDAMNQKKISDRVSQIAQNLGVAYIDITPELRALSSQMDTTLYMPNGHFTLYGYDLYAQFLARQVSE